MTGGSTSGQPDEAGKVSVEIPVPDDWHVHLRDDEMLEAVVDFTARWFRCGLVMPNLVPPITTVDQARSYRQRILDAVSIPTHSFDPWMTLFLTPELGIDELRAGVKAQVVRAVKFYPAGATTNSEHGAGSLLGFGRIFDEMAELDVPLLVHAESTDPEIDVFEREATFLELEVAPILAKIPELSVTIEHISTAAGIELVRGHDQAWGSITPHHLLCDRSDILANGLRPELYCKPVLNSGQNRRALVAAATSGDPKFFLGTDSAPHPLSQKQARVAKAGIFCAPYDLEVCAEIFYQAGALDLLGDFVSRNGARRYGINPSDQRLMLSRSGDAQPLDLGRSRGRGQRSDELIGTASGEQVRVFGVAQADRWSIERL